MRRSAPCRRPPQGVSASTSSQLRQLLSCRRLAPHGNRCAPSSRVQALCRFPASQFSSRWDILATDASLLPDAWQNAANSGASSQDTAAYQEGSRLFPPLQMTSTRGITVNSFAPVTAASAQPPSTTRKPVFSPEVEYKLQAFPSGQFYPRCSIQATGAPQLPYSSQHTAKYITSCQDTAAYQAGGKPVIPPPSNQPTPPDTSAKCGG